MAKGAGERTGQNCQAQGQPELHSLAWGSTVMNDQPFPQRKTVHVHDGQKTIVEGQQGQRRLVKGTKNTVTVWWVLA